MLKCNIPSSLKINFFWCKIITRQRSKRSVSHFIAGKWENIDITHQTSRICSILSIIDLIDEKRAMDIIALWNDFRIAEIPFEHYRTRLDNRNCKRINSVAEKNVDDNHTVIFKDQDDNLVFNTYFCDAILMLHRKLFHN